MDYCTGWFEGNWSQCCKAHDLAYAAGVQRFTADWTLFKCVFEVNPLVAIFMFVAVSVLGWLFYKKGKTK